MIWLFVAFAGLCLGSFVNALVWRVHEQAVLEESKAKNLGNRLRELSIVKGRSQCPDCGHTLAAKDLIPVFSWLSLGGKCRYCNKPISPQYPVVELLTAIAITASFIVWPYEGNTWSAADAVVFIAWALLVTGFMALSVYDLRWFLLPDRIVAPLTGIGFVFALSRALTSDKPVHTLFGSAIGAVVIAGLFYGLYQASQGKWIGGGDVKLGILLGLLAGGFAEALLLLFVASVAGTLYSLLLALISKQKFSRKLRIPFGPFLLLAAVIVVLWGPQIIDWYTNMLITA
jgi:leader peptidase (prepilin peptidase)/N-methyltransferase